MNRIDIQQLKATMRIVTFSCCVVLITSSLHSLDIDTAVNTALKNRGDISIISNQVLLQENIIDSRLRAFYPDISLSASYDKSKVYILNSNTYQMNTGLDVNYPIFDGGERGFELELENTRLKLLELNYTMKKKEIEYNVKHLFYDAVLSKKIIELRMKYLEQAEKDKVKAETMYSEKVTDKLGLLTADYYYQLSGYQLQTASNSYNQKTQALLNYIQVQESITPDGELQKEENIDTNREDVRVIYFETQKKINSLAYKKTKASLGWKAGLFSGFYLSEEKTDFSRWNDQYTFQCGVKIFFPIADFASVEASPNYQTIPRNYDSVSRDSSKIAPYEYFFMPSEYDTISAKGTIRLFDENNSDINRQQAYLDYSRQDVEFGYQIDALNTERQLCKNKLLELELNIFSCSNGIELNLLNYDKMNMLYQNGEKTAKDLLDARIKISDSEIGYLQAIFDYNNFVWKMRSVIGD